jgi:hypothetical protein
LRSACSGLTAPRTRKNSLRMGVFQGFIGVIAFIAYALPLMLVTDLIDYSARPPEARAEWRAKKRALLGHLPSHKRTGCDHDSTSIRDGQRRRPRGRWRRAAPDATRYARLRMNCELRAQAPGLFASPIRNLRDVQCLRSAEGYSREKYCQEYVATRGTPLHRCSSRNEVNSSVKRARPHFVVRLFNGRVAGRWRRQGACVPAAGKAAAPPDASSRTQRGGGVSASHGFGDRHRP